MRKQVELTDCRTMAQAADIFTNGFTSKAMWNHVSELIGMVDKEVADNLLKNSVKHSQASAARKRGNGEGVQPKTPANAKRVHASPAQISTPKLAKPATQQTGSGEPRRPATTLKGVGAGSQGVNLRPPSAGKAKPTQVKTGAIAPKGFAIGSGRPLATTLKGVGARGGRER